MGERNVSMRVLFIDIDTLRPDHMGCYGYHRNTTPNMDKVCRDGIRFDQYYCSDAPAFLPGHLWSAVCSVSTTAPGATAAPPLTAA